MMQDRNIFVNRGPIRLLGLLRFSLSDIDELFILDPVWASIMVFQLGQRSRASARHDQEVVMYKNVQLAT